MADVSEVDLVAAAKVVHHWLDEKPINPEATGPLIDCWMALLGLNDEADERDYEARMIEAVKIAYDLADPRPEPPSTTVTVEQVDVQGEVL